MPRPHLSIKDLFGIVTFCSIVAWSASQVGFDNVLFWMVVGLSSIVSALFVFLARDDKRRHFAMLAPLPVVLLLCLPVVSLTLFVNGLLLFVAGIICAIQPPLRVRTLWAIAMISASLALVAGVLPGILEMRDLLALRQDYPVLSLQSRLEYERRHRQSNKASDWVMNANLRTQLDRFEADLEADNFRAFQLRQIHNRQYERFVRAMGFGVGRMLRPRSESLRRPPLEDLSFDEGSVAELETGRNDWRAARNAGTSDDVEHLHTISRYDFLDPDSFGVSTEPIVQVVGFVEHGFHYSPIRGLKDRESWKIARLELVSLLRFDEPQVYVLDRLPRMDQLSSEDVPTRPLNEFESEALQRLHTEQDLVVSQEGSQYRMLGSLRAAKQCIECHNVKRGELLGAFSYVLYRGGTSDDLHPLARSEARERAAGTRARP